MKKLILLLLLVPVICLANLGDTVTMLESRLPDAVLIKGGPAEDDPLVTLNIYRSPKYDIAVMILDGEVVSEFFVSIHDAPFSKEFIFEHMLIYGVQWQELPPSAAQPGATAFASPDGVLMVIGPAKTMHVQNGLRFYSKKWMEYVAKKTAWLKV